MKPFFKIPKINIKISIPRKQKDPLKEGLKFMIKYAMLSLKPRAYRRKIPYWEFHNKRVHITASRSFLMIPNQYSDVELIRDGFTVSKWLEDAPSSIALFIKIKNPRINMLGKTWMFLNSELFKPDIVKKFNVDWVAKTIAYSESPIIIDGEPKPLTSKTPLNYAILRYDSKNAFIVFLRE